MNCNETMTVNAKAVNWLKEKYPELCIKAGLCERVAGRLYTKTFTTPPAAPVQEPVKHWCTECKGHDTHKCRFNVSTPPAAQRQWVGLTDEEITDCKRTEKRYLSSQEFARAIEAKLREKNGGQA